MFVSLPLARVLRACELLLAARRYLLWPARTSRRKCSACPLVTSLGAAAIAPAEKKIVMLRGFRIPIFITHKNYFIKL